MFNCKKIIIVYIVILFFINFSIAKASCSASAFSSPNDLFGQTFNCSDGSSYTYERNSFFGDTITNNETGNVYNSDIFSNTSDEYGAFGRNFSDGDSTITLERGSILGDSFYKN